MFVVFYFFFVRIVRPPSATCTHTPFPYTAPSRSTGRPSRDPREPPARLGVLAVVAVLRSVLRLYPLARPSLSSADRVHRQQSGIRVRWCGRREQGRRAWRLDGTCKGPGRELRSVAV